MFLYTQNTLFEMICTVLRKDTTNPAFIGVLQEYEEFLYGSHWLEK